MKFIIFITFYFIALSNRAQDSLKLVNKDIVLAKILEVDMLEIRYKKFLNINGPTYVIEKSEVESITYSNHTTEFFSKGVSGAIVKNGPQILLNDSLIFIEDLYLNKNYTLFLTTGITVNSKIISVNSEKIVYRKLDFMNGPMYYCAPNEIIKAFSIID